MTRIDAILESLRRELTKRPQALEGGMTALLLTCYFEGDTGRRDTSSSAPSSTRRPVGVRARSRIRAAQFANRDYRAVHKFDGA